MSTNLCDFERSLLRQLAGVEPSQPWGAAVGVALEFLKGSGYVSVQHDTDGIHYQITDKGRQAIGLEVK